MSEEATSSKGTSKKGVSIEETRRRREDKTIAVRKEKKDENIKKRRQVSQAWADPADATPNSNGSVAPEIGALQQSSMAAASSLDAASGKSFTVADMPAMMKGMCSSDTSMQIANLRGFRRLLSVEKNPPVQQSIDCGAVPMFVQFLQRSDSPELQFEAAWALTNIASTDRTRVVVECSAVPYLAQLLNSPNPEIREQAAWCLGNVAGDGADLRDVVLANHAMPFLLANIAQPANISLLRNCTWTLSNFCRGKPAPSLDVVKPALSVLTQVLLQCSDEDTVVDATWAFSYISDGANERIQAVVDQGIIPTLVNMLHSNKAAAITPALRTLGNIVSGSDLHTQAVVDANVFAAIVPLLSNSKKNIRKEACWMLSNIAAGTEEQMQLTLTTPNLIGKVLEQMSSSAEWDVRKEAAWVISNLATGGKAPHLSMLVEAGTIKHICDLLDAGDTRVTTIAMEALEALLKTLAGSKKYNIVQMIDEADGINRIEQLQEHSSNAIYQKAVSMIDTYFTEDEHQDESENLAPQISGNTFSFGLPAGGATGLAKMDFGSGFMQSASAAPSFQF